jgi:hypothetical protein
VAYFEHKEITAEDVTAQYIEIMPRLASKSLLEIG